MAILAAMAVFLFIFVIIGLGLYVLGAVGLYVISKRRGLENPWLAFIPVVQLHLVGKLIKRLNLFGIEIPKPEIYLPVLVIIAAVLSNIRYVGVLFSLANLVLCFGSFYYLFKQYKDQGTAILYTIFTPIFLFVIRNTDPIEENKV